MSTNTPLIQGISEQFGAALKMVEDIIVECNDELWNDFNQQVVVSQVVYHTLSSMYFFLSKDKNERDAFHGKYGDEDGDLHLPDRKLTKKQLTDYLEEVKAKANSRFKELTIEELNQPPLFDWHGTSVLGSFFYNLRHAMLHIGALHVRVNAVNKSPLRWVSKIYGDERDKREEMNSRGVAYLQQGNLDEAEKIYLELIETYKDDPLFYYNLACCYSLQKNSNKSIDTLKTCLELDKDKRFKETAKKDSDFDNVRELTEFKNLLNI